jgi:hypothetical protein
MRNTSVITGISIDETFRAGLFIGFCIHDVRISYNCCSFSQNEESELSFRHGQETCFFSQTSRPSFTFALNQKPILTYDELPSRLLQEALKYRNFYGREFIYSRVLIF